MASSAPRGMSANSQPGAQQLGAAAVGDAEQVAHDQPGGDRGAVGRWSRQFANSVPCSKATPTGGTAIATPPPLMSRMRSSVLRRLPSAWGRASVQVDRMRERCLQAVELAPLQAQQAVGQRRSGSLGCRLHRPVAALEQELDAHLVELGHAVERVGAQDAFVLQGVGAGVEQQAVFAVVNLDQRGQVGLAPGASRALTSARAADDVLEDREDLATVAQQVLGLVLGVDEFDAGVFVVDRHACVPGVPA